MATDLRASAGLVIAGLVADGETVVDRIGRERHELSGRAKDIASAAVLAAIVNAAVVWLLILCARG